MQRTAWHSKTNNAQKGMYKLLTENKEDDLQAIRPWRDDTHQRDRHSSTTIQHVFVAIKCVSAM